MLDTQTPPTVTAPEDISPLLEAGQTVRLAGVDTKTGAVYPFLLSMRGIAQGNDLWEIGVEYDSVLMVGQGPTRREAYMRLMNPHVSSAMAGVPQPIRDGVYVALYHHTQVFRESSPEGRGR